MSDEAANKKARELMEYCSGAAWQDGVAAIAAALREKDAEIQKLKFDADLREDEITRLIKQYDVTDTKLEAAREQLERAKLERDALKRTYDKTVERLSRELEAARAVTEQAKAYIAVENESLGTAECEDCHSLIAWDKSKPVRCLDCFIAILAEVKP